MYYTIDEIEEFGVDKFEVGDIICYYVHSDGYNKGEVEFIINKNYEVEPHTKVDFRI